MSNRQHFVFNKERILELLQRASISRLVLEYHGKKGGGEVDAFYFYDAQGVLLELPPPEIAGVDILIYRTRKPEPVPWPIGLAVYEWVYDFLDFKLASWVWGSRGSIEFNVTKQCVIYFYSTRKGSPVFGNF